MALRTDLEPVRNLYQLCFVKPPWAWFTRLPLSHQWGDGWERAPWQREAGLPYGGAPDRLIKVAFDGPFVAPEETPERPALSVEDINNGKSPWLHSDTYLHNAPIAIMGGTTLERFVELVDLGGGHVFVPLGCAEPHDDAYVWPDML